MQLEGYKFETDYSLLEFADRVFKMVFAELETRRGRVIVLLEFEVRVFLFFLSFLCLASCDMLCVGPCSLTTQVGADGF